MKEFKSIITHPEGQNLFPNQITAIEGYPHGTSITMKNTKPQIAITPYGASYMQPDMDYKFAGSTVVELPQAQMGGQDQQQQLMQMIQMYAEMKGMKPEELIQKIQSLPQDQQQQAIQSIAQEVQQVMAQQQQAQQQQGPEGMGQEEQMMEQGMMSYGGEPCIECFDNYNPSPQAQDLNWYYKATGGEAFPQANMYPKDWASYSGNQYQIGRQTGMYPQNNPLFSDLYSSSDREDMLMNLFNSGKVSLGQLPKKLQMQETFTNNAFNNMLSGTPGSDGVYRNYEIGGEAFPQAQTYLPYDRAGETRPNFMFQAGGRKEEYGPYKDSAPGGAGRQLMTPEQFRQGMKQYSDAATNYGKNNLSEEDYAKLNDLQLNLLQHMTYDSDKLQDSSWRDWMNMTTAPIVNPARRFFNQTFDTHFQAGGQSDIDKIYQIMKKGGMDLNPRKKKGGKFNHLDDFQKYIKGEKKGNKFQEGGEENTDGLNFEGMFEDPYENASQHLQEDFYDLAYDINDGYTGSDKSKVDNNSNKTDNNSNTAENYQKGKRSSYDKMMQANALNGAAAMTGNKGLFGAIAAVNNIGRAVGAAAQGWSHPGRAFGRQSKKETPVYGKGFNRLENSDMMQNGVGPKPESTLNKSVPALDKDRYNLNQNDVYDYSNISGSTQMQGGGNTQDPRFVEYDRFANRGKNNGIGDIFGQDKRKYASVGQKEGKPKRRKPTGSCVDGRCYEFQDGGPYVYVSPNQSDSYFNPLSGDIYLNEDQSHIPGVLPHEMHHYDQWVNGKFKVPGGAYMGEENLPESLNPYLPLMMPSIVRDQSFEGEMPYYNRRPIEQVAMTNDFLSSNPSFSLVDQGLVYDKAVNPSLYMNPYTLEGEAQIVGDQYMGPFQRGGGLPKHQSWISQVGKHWQDQFSPNNATANQIVNKQVKGADPNEKWSGEPDFALGDSLVAGLGQAADYIGNFKRRNSPDKDKERRNIKTSEFMDVAQFGGGQYGDWSTNATQGTSFRPDEMVYAQKMGRPYKDVNVFDYPTYDFKDMFQSGGSVLDNYDEDGEYDLTQEEIDEIIAAGGTIEYL